MKNLYKQTMEEIKLDDAAKERIYNGVVNKLKEEKTEKKRTPFSLKAFRLATACASAALVCGAAIGTGVYFGNRNIGEYENAYGGESEIYLYYLDRIFEKTEFDLNNVELTVSYGFKEEDLRGLYLNRLKAGEEELGEILDFELNLVAQSMDDDNNVYDRYYCRSIKINNINEFPFDKYDYDIISYDEIWDESSNISHNYPNNVSYNHSEKVLLPANLFILDGNEHKIYMYIYERVEYSLGFSNERQTFYTINPETFFKDGFMSVDGKISGYNHYTSGGFVSGFYYGVEEEHATFTYKYCAGSDKIVISYC